MTDREALPWSVDDDPFTCGIVLTFWNKDHADVAHEVLIKPEDVDSFVRQVTNHGLVAMRTAVKRIYAGDCGTCGNTGLVDKPGAGGRTSNEYCPDCKSDRQAEPFGHIPQIGGGWS